MRRGYFLKEISSCWERLLSSSDKSCIFGISCGVIGRQSTLLHLHESSRILDEISCVVMQMTEAQFVCFCENVRPFLPLGIYNEHLEVDKQPPFAAASVVVNDQVVSETVAMSALPLVDAKVFEVSKTSKRKRKSRTNNVSTNKCVSKRSRKDTAANVVAEESLISAKSVKSQIGHIINPLLKKRPLVHSKKEDHPVQETPLKKVRVNNKKGRSINREEHLSQVVKQIALAMHSVLMKKSEKRMNTSNNPLMVSDVSDTYDYEFQERNKRFSKQPKVC